MDAQGALSDFINERLNAEHRRQHRLHDAQCEWREAGYFLCHCSKRRREAVGFTEPPTLSMNYPTCSNCGEQVDHDDGWVCPRCNVFWPISAGEDTPGTFTDDYGTLDPSRYE